MANSNSKELSLELSFSPGKPFNPFYMGMHNVVMESVHFHRGLEIITHVAGEGTLILNEKSYPIVPGALLFFDAMISHFIQNTKNLKIIVAHVANDATVNIHFEKGDLRLLRPFTGLRAGVSPVLRNRPDLQKKMEQANTRYESGDSFGKLFAWLDVAAIMCEIAKYVADNTQTEFGSAWVRGNEITTRVMEYLENNIQTKVTLADIADHVSVSVSRMAHLFKEHTGLSPIEHLHRMRIALATQKITQTNDKISTIAYDCGFKSVSKFHFQFRQITGKTPHSLRSINSSKT